ncbi:MAG: MotA/TolQ/ExbB proton channel family protein [Verrucomicrobia bacterium]|nr:MotA/TolQ/ExbB proton channel family protein [Verrucomicrobiota bacterium]
MIKPEPWQRSICRFFSGKDPSREAGIDAGASSFPDLRMPPEVRYRWSQLDPERRLGFSGGRFTGPKPLPAFLAGTVLTAIFYALVIWLHGHLAWSHPVTQAFLREANLWTVVPLSLLFFFSVALLAGKTLKLGLQQKAMGWAVVPASADFILNENTAEAVLQRIQGLVDQPDQFVILNRIERGLSNLHYLGQVSEVSSVLRGQADDDEKTVASSFTLLQGLVWAMPVLGFVGTAQGLAFAMGKFRLVLGEQGTDLAAIKQSLQEVTLGLSTSFETTLVALVFALTIQIWITFRQRAELEFLDSCNDYCQRYVISKLRLASGGVRDTYPN